MPKECFQGTVIGLPSGKDVAVSPQSHLSKELLDHFTKNLEKVMVKMENNHGMLKAVTVGWLVGRSVGRSVGRLVGWLVCNIGGLLGNPYETNDHFKGIYLQ